MKARLSPFPLSGSIALRAALVALSSASITRSAPLAAEDFNSYSSQPPTNLSGLSGGSGWASGWSVGAIVQGYLNEVRSAEGGAAANLSYPAYEANGGNYANLAAGYGGPDFNYIQRGVDLAGTFAPYATTNAGGFPVAGVDGTTIWGSFLYHNLGGLKLWLQQQTAPQETSNAIFDVPTTGSNSLFLFRLDFGTGNADTMTIWNNPDLATWNPASLPSAVSAGDYSFSNFIFVAPSPTNEARIDHIRLGSSAIDVVPYTNTGSSPYAVWAISEGLDPGAPDGAPGGDKDQDGALNLNEYAFSSDPNSGSSLPVITPAVDATNLTATYLRFIAATDVAYAPEASPDLVNWSNVGITDLPTGTSSPEAAEYRITAPVGPEAKKFIRIKVTLIPTP